MLTHDKTHQPVIEALDKLAALGSADQIRDFFFQEQIYGCCGSRDCPVSNYLFKETGHRYEVGSKELYAHNDNTTSVRHPHVVAQFVSRFDAGRYEELRRAPGGQF